MGFGLSVNLISDSNLPANVHIDEWTDQIFLVSHPSYLLPKVACWLLIDIDWFPQTATPVFRQGVTFYIAPLVVGAIGGKFDIDT
jgi:hypothetical protein